METEGKMASLVAQAVSLLYRRLTVGAAFISQRSSLFPTAASQRMTPLAPTLISPPSCSQGTTPHGVVPFQVAEYQWRSCPIVPDRRGVGLAARNSKFETQPHLNPGPKYIRRQNSRSAEYFVPRGTVRISFGFRHPNFEFSTYLAFTRRSGRVYYQYAHRR